MGGGGSQSVRQSIDIKSTTSILEKNIQTNSQKVQAAATANNSIEASVGINPMTGEPGFITGCSMNFKQTAVADAQSSATSAIESIAESKQEIANDMKSKVAAALEKTSEAGNFQFGDKSNTEIDIKKDIQTTVENVFEKENLPERIMISFWEWLPWVFLACIAVFIQISAEEMLFRGYLLQQLISRFKSFWVWAFFPSVVFGLGHFDYQSFGQNTYFYMVNAAIFGMLTSILTVKSKNLTYALGMHFFNNIIGVLFFGMGDNFSGLALINYYVDKTGIYMTYIIISQTLFHLITFLILFYWIKTYKSPL